MEAPDFFLLDVEGRVKAVRGEDLGGDDAAEVVPVLTTGGGRDHGEVVADVLAEKKVWAVGEDSVIPSEAFFDERPRGDDKDAADTKLEVDDGAVGSGEGAEGPVDGLL